MSKLTADQISCLADAVRRVVSIDSVITDIGRRVVRGSSDDGEKIRHTISRNLFGDLTDIELGHIVMLGAINMLLDKRARIVSAFQDLVDFPAAPCPRQEIEEESQ